MAVGRRDVEIEQAVEGEDIREIREVKEAQKLILEMSDIAEKLKKTGINYLNKGEYQELFNKAEYIIRHLANAKRHSKTIIALSKKIRGDIEGVRGTKKLHVPLTKKSKSNLTDYESSIISKCLGIDHLLDEARALVEQLQDSIENLLHHHNFDNIFNLIFPAKLRIENIIYILQQLYVMQKQVEQALRVGSIY